MVGGNVREDLGLAAGPADFHAFGLGGSGQPEMQPGILLEHVAGGAAGLGGLGASAGGHLDHGAKAVAVAAGAFEFERQPMVLLGPDIAQHQGALSERGHDQIQAAVIIQVERAAAARVDFLLKKRPAFGGGIDE